MNPADTRTVAVPAPEGPEIRGTESAGHARTHPAPLLEVRFDFEVIDLYLEFARRGGAGEQDLKRWVRLPGNRELLRQGRLEGGLTPDILAEAARVALNGGLFPSPPTLGSLVAGDRETLGRILDSVRNREEEMIARAMAALRPYLGGHQIARPLVVYFHLGGSWDGRSTDAVYINLTLYQARGEESLAGLDALLVHELFHQTQSVLLPGVEDYSSRQSALYTVMLRMQQEGIARHLEYGYLLRAVPEDALDRTNVDKYSEGLKRAGSEAAELERIRAAIAGGRLDQARVMAQRALTGGGPLYSVGHGLADSIERAGGTAALAATVAAGPLEFLRAYERSVPSGGLSLLSEGLRDDLDRVGRGYGKDPVLASAKRREGLVLLSGGRLREARAALKVAVGIDPTDATSAYNMACAFALEGRKDRSLRWLEKSFERGFDKYKHAALDEDLEILRDEPEFETLLRSRGFNYRRSREARREPKVNP